MNKLRSLSLLLTAIVMLSLASGCGDKPGSQNKTDGIESTPSEGSVSENDITSEGMIAIISFKDLVANADGILIGKVESISDPYVLSKKTMAENEITTDDADITVMRDGKVKVEQWIKDTGDHSNDLTLNMLGGEVKVGATTIHEEDYLQLQPESRVLIFIQDIKYFDKYPVTTVIGFAQGVFMLPANGPGLKDASELPNNDISHDEMKAIIQELGAVSDYYVK